MNALLVLLLLLLTFASQKPPRHHIYYCEVPFTFRDARGNQHWGSVTGPCMYRTNTPVDV